MGVELNVDVELGDFLRVLGVGVTMGGFRCESVKASGHGCESVEMLG